MSSDKKSFQSDDLVPEVGVITGTRPGFIMAAPAIRELVNRGIPHFIIHSGQHYSPNMDELICNDLELPRPDYRFEGLADRPTHGAQTGYMLEQIEKVLLERRPAVMLIFGDTNSNLAAALAARKLHIAVAHVEAGERCHDWRKPEEHNRKMIDVIADYLFASGPKATANLQKEGIPLERIIETGNPIVDSSHFSVNKAKRESDALERFSLTAGRYALMTMHREENVDNEESLRRALTGVNEATGRTGLDKTLFLGHPRTLKRIEQFGLTNWVAQLEHLQVEPGVGFLDFLCLLSQSALTFTDSGGVSQETCIHHIPCVCMLEKTEWTEPVESGVQILVGCDSDKIVKATERFMSQEEFDYGEPFGDGRAGEYIVNVLADHIGRKK